MTDPRITAALDYLADPEFLEAPDGTVSKAAYDVTATLVAVLRKVAEIHAPVESPSDRLVCAGCATHVTFTPYPCATARALAPLAELGAGETPCCADGCGYPVKTTGQVCGECAEAEDCAP